MDSHWIWTPDWIHADKKTPRIVYFRKIFNIDSVPEEAVLTVTADTRYKLYMNGSLVEVGPSRGDGEVWFADHVDVSRYLKQGTNVIAVIVLRYPLERQLGNHGMFRTEMPCLYIEGSISGKDISTDASWKCRVNRQVELYQEEERFAPLVIHEHACGDDSLHGWMSGSYDDRDWPDAAVYPAEELDHSSVPVNFRSRTIPFMKRIERRFNDPGSVTIPAHTRASLVLDAGEEMTGYITASMSGGRGAEISLLYSECYVTDEISPTSGTPIKRDRTNSSGGHLTGYSDTYTAAGIGTCNDPEIYTPFWFRTFRYIEVGIGTAEEPLTIDDLSYTETGYPLEVRAEVLTSDPSLGEIWEISERTLRRCMHESYEDCPFYEQLQYAMDTRSQILYTYAASGDDRLARKAIDDFARAQYSSGLINCSYPNTNRNVIPGFSIYYILMIHDHMMYFGDESLVKRYMPAVDRILNYFDRHVDDDGLVGKVGGVNGESSNWSFIDWAREWNPTTGMPPAGLYGPLTMESLLYIYGLQKGAELAEFIGRNETADEYLKRAAGVRDAVRRCCMTEGGLLTDGPGSSDISQHAQVFGVLTDVLDAEEGRTALERTFADPSCAKCTVATQFYLFRALEKAGMYEYTARQWDIWREMIRNNCTTCVESEDYSRSECHAWGALALYELPSVVLGVRPGAPGWGVIEVAPHAEYLEYASGTAVTGRGDVRVSWDKRRRGDEAVVIEAPEGAEIAAPEGARMIRYPDTRN